MAKKKMRSMLSEQRAKLKAQKAAKAAKQAKAPKLPPGKKGGAIVKSKGSSITKSTKGSVPTKTAPKALPGKPTPKALPAGKAGGALAKAGKLGTGGKLLGGAGLLLSGVSTTKDLTDSLKRGEGYAKLFKKAKTKSSKSKAGSRAAVNRKPKEEAKPKRKATGYNRRGRPTGYAAEAKPAKRGMSNIPSKEGTGKGSPTDKKPTTSTKTSTRVTKPVTGASRGGSGGTKAAAYSKDARNKEYDRLRKAGKTKEAEALGKKIAADTRKKAPKNPFRAPQGAERKDKSYKAVQELKAMGKQKPKAKTAEKKKKKPQSAANKKGWSGNRNY